VKIQEPSYQPLFLSTMDLTKKADTSLIVQAETITDSHTPETNLLHIEKEVLQVLKTMISDLRNAADMFHGDSQNIVFPDINVKSSERWASPVPEHTIILLFLTEKGEAPKNPAKIFLSYKADKTQAEIRFPPELVGKVAEEARRLVNTIPGKGVLALRDTKEEGSDNVRAKSGFVIGFSYFPHVPGKESAAASPLAAASSAQEDGMSQPPEWVDTYHVSGNVFDSQYLNCLSLLTGEEGEVVEELQILGSGIQPGSGQDEGTGVKAFSKEDQMVGVRAGNTKNTIELQEMSTEPPSQSVHGEKNRVRGKNIENATEARKTQTELSLQSSDKENNFVVVVPLDVQKSKNEVVLVKDEPAIRANGLIKNDEGELRGTALKTGFGQGELKSSPVAGFPLLSFDDDLSISRIVTFIGRLNMLFNGNGTVDTVLDESVSDGTVPSTVSLKKLHLLQTRFPQARAVIQNVLKKVFGEFEEISGLESIGFLLGKHGSLCFDTSILVSQLTSNEEETINVMKGFGNAAYERINYLMHPCAGMYINDKNILQLRAAQKDEGASLPNRELSKEQNNLEKRLNELKLLIERSRLLTEWFTRDKNVPVDDPEEIGRST